MINIKKDWPIWIILLIPIIIAVFVYPYMPDQVPMHWNINGEVDNYGSKTVGTFMMPLMNAGLYFLFILLPKLDPRKENYQKFLGSYQIIRYAVHVFMALMFLLVVAASLGYAVDIGLWVSVGVDVLFIIMGNIMGRVRHNYFVGFRLPWTLANEEVWRKTHQTGAKAMVLGGVLALIGVLLTENNLRFIILMSGIFIPIIFISVYSYVLFRKSLTR
ncbi:SdpI family protein [Sinanaerobacter chloroacetimidivorans]|uniref:SdpI family protein n=1 Tax=Sinanaerobacter chloroacetimidivorans TaxID=2818044 RepID=A0A8J8B549_9FIRM|nr:DUF1648 domain-containing protein [Sinanaerobacter chloroacetimidivorans]MBR0599995.1 SdpI family protein [Sinanaerobacter chloroacetimidivorans]